MNDLVKNLMKKRTHEKIKDASPKYNRYQALDQFSDGKFRFAPVHCHFFHLLVISNIKRFMQNTNFSTRIYFFKWQWEFFCFFSNRHLDKF